MVLPLTVSVKRAMLPRDFQLAPDFPERLREFIAAVGAENQQAALFAAVLPKQISEWLAGRQKPSRQRLNLLLTSTPGGPYPPAIFAAGGPRPRDTINAARLTLTELREQSRRHGTREMAPSELPPQAAHSALTAEEIVELVTHAIAVQIRHLAEKGPHATGMWLLGAASSANHQGINDVKPLIDLARRLLNEGEESALRGDPGSMLETYSPKRTGS